MANVAKHVLRVVACIDCCWVDPGDERRTRSWRPLQI